MSRLVASSTSKSLAVVKILIDLDEYLRLKTLKSKYEEAEEKLKNCLQNHDQEKNSTEKAYNENQDPLSSKTTETKELVNQIGSGQDHQKPLDAHSIKEISDIVVQKLSASFTLVPKTTETSSSQIGSGAQRATQINSPSTSSDLLQPSATHSEIKDNTFLQPIIIKEGLQSESESITEQKLLKLIPEKFKPQAAELLHEINDRPNQLTFNSDGIVFINQIGIPDTNFYILFPALFKKSQSKNIPGFSEIVIQIATMGLGHLISKSYTKGLLRKYKIGEQDLLYNQIINLKHWWYLGSP